MTSKIDYSSPESIYGNRINVATNWLMSLYSLMVLCYPDYMQATNTSATKGDEKDIQRNEQGTFQTIKRMWSIL